MFRKLTTAQVVVDLAIPGALFLVLLATYFSPSDGWVRVWLLIGYCAAFAFRRLHPGVALAIAWVPSLIQVIAGMEPDPLSIVILPVLYATARYGSALIKWLGFGSAILGSAIIAVYLATRRMWWSAECGFAFDLDCLSFSAMQALASSIASLFFLFAALFVLSWTLGLLAKTWARARLSNEARAAAEQTVVVEQERGRIARDMHDVVAHSLAVVIAQADGARYARDKNPDAVDSALETISATAREALGDVRVLLAQLRRDESQAPQRALADLDRLVGQFQASGLDVVVDRDGEPDDPGLGVQLAVYRIVQEGLTNALRHGDASRPVSVDFDWRDTEVELRIENATLTDHARGTLGHGLAGMRERAQLAGGTFEVTDADGAFAITATLPLTAAVAS